MQPLGIIAGTISLHGEPPLGALHLQEEKVETPFGPATVFRSAELVFLPRHGKDPHHHILPHRINHAANLQAMKALGVREVVGIHSTGSLKRRLKPGSLVVPDDYLMLTPGPTVIGDRPVHITPCLSEEVRRKWLEAAKACDCPVIDGGTYWQTAGPRLETRAEIAMMSQFADLVGMTMASEAIVAQELSIPFASLCSVDNFAHGLDAKGLTMEKILWHARRNAERIAQILDRYLQASR